MALASLQVWDEVQEALARQFAQQKPRILVLDDQQANYLQAQLPGYEVEGLYAYLSRKADSFIASGLDIYKAFQKALRQILGPDSAMPFLEGWEYAKNFSEDIREILLSFSPEEFMAPLLDVWKRVAEEKALQELFALKDGNKELPWLEVLHLPRTSQGPTIRALYEHLPELVQTFLNNLGIEYPKVLGEELFRKEPIQEKLILWNIFSTEPRIQEWIAYQVKVGGAQAWGWDVGPLQACIGEPPWPGANEADDPASLRRLQGADFHSRSFVLRLDQAFLPWGERTVYLYDAFRSKGEVLEAVARDLAHAYGEGCRVGLWVGEAQVKPLLERLLREVGFTGPSIVQPTLAETHVGTLLRQAYQKQIIPAPESLLSSVPDHSAEKQAFELYELFYEGTEKRTPEALLHFLRFLGRIPAPMAQESGSAHFMSGALAQLAGLAYEKLFIVLPPAEPLGSWFRPSFLPVPVRRLYYPPTYRTQTAWRLLLLLLYGARETYLYQVAGEENRSPLEEFLIYFSQASPCLEELWTIRRDSKASPAYPSTSWSSADALIPLPIYAPCVPPESISPSDLYNFLQCSRRYYLSKIVGIPQGMGSVEVFLGNWLHAALSAALIGPSGVERRSLRRRSSVFLADVTLLQKRFWAPRRLYRILRSAYYRAQRMGGPILPPLPQNPEMRFWQRLWAQSGSIFSEHIHRHLAAIHHTQNLLLYPEVWITPRLAPQHEATLRGRLDLLIATPQNTPLLAVDYKTGTLGGKLGEWANFRQNWIDALEWLKTNQGTSQYTIRSIDFQAFTYLINFPPGFKLIVANASNKNNYEEYELSQLEQQEVRDLWTKSFKLLRERHKELCTQLSAGSEEAKRRAVDRLFPMTPEKRRCSYCPFKLLCQRL